MNDKVVVLNAEKTNFDGNVVLVPMTPIYDDSRRNSSRGFKGYDIVVRNPRGAELIAQFPIRLNCSARPAPATTTST